MSGAQDDRGAAVRLAGVVREVSSPPPSSWAIHPKGGAAKRHSDAGWASVEVEGRAVRVDTEGAWLVGDAKATEGAWRDLDDAAGGRFGAGPTPFTPARLTVVTIAPGDAVEVYGEVVERRFDDDGAFREAPTTSLARVRGLVVARGDDATAELTRAIARRYPPAKRAVKAKKVERPDPRRGDPGSPLHRPPGSAWLGAGLAAAVALGALALALWLHAWYLVFTIGFVATALLARPERTARIYRARDERIAGHAGNLQTLLLLLYAGGIFGLLGVAGPLAYTITTGVFLVLAIALELAQLGTVARHRQLIATPAWNGEIGVRALVAGTVRDPTPVTVGKGAAAAMARETAYDKAIGSDPDTVKWTRFHAAGTFLVDAPAGVVEVAPDELIWASTVVESPDNPSFDYEVVELIPIGGKVAAAGWIEHGVDGGPPRLRSKGTAPAVLLATSPLGDPRGLAARMVWHRRITLIGLAACAAAFVAVVIALP